MMGPRASARWILAGMLAAAAPARADDQELCLDASSSAQDLRRDKRLGEARAQLLVCARESCPAVVRRDCAEWLVEVDAAMPTVVITAKDDRGADIVAARILVDGKLFLDHLEGKALPIDPGVHAVHVEVEGATPQDQQLVVREGEKNRLVELTIARPVVVEPPPPVTAPPVTAPPVTAPPVTTPTPHPVDAPAPDDPQRLRRHLGLAAIGVGVVGIGIGTAFGVKASSKWSDAKDACGAGCTAGTPAYALREDARSAATISTVSFITGGLAVAGGAVLFLTSRHSKTQTMGLAVVRALTTGYVGYEGAF